MSIKKQEFYEGAALHILVRGGGVERLQYDAPFFVVNGNTLIHLKYSTKNRSPWGFTFTADEQALLEDVASRSRIVIGLVCGSDGIAALDYDEYRRIANRRESAIHIASYRAHREHYEISGPDGTLERKIAPSDWQKNTSPPGPA
jgi:hypothetical protein